MKDKHGYLRELRIQAGYTQEEIAEILGVTKSTISKYEKGLRRINSDYIEKLSALYHVEPIFIITGKTTAEFEKEIDEINIQDYKEDRAYWESVLLSEPVVRMMPLLDQLNSEGQQKAVERVEELTEILRYRTETAHQLSAEIKKGTDIVPSLNSPEEPQEPSEEDNTNGN